MSPRPNLTIRPRQASDLPALIPIHHAVYAATGYPVEGPYKTDAEVISFLSGTSPESQFWVAETSTPSNQSGCESSTSTSTSADADAPAAAPATTKVIGHVALTPFVRNAREADWAAAGNTHENARHLGRLFVSPDAQGLGVGRALVGKVMEAAREQGVRLSIYVVTKDVAATAVYEKLGWRRIGMETYRGWDNWMYVWHPEWEIGVGRGRKE